MIGSGSSASREEAFSSAVLQTHSLSSPRPRLRVQREESPGECTVLAPLHSPGQGTRKGSGRAVPTPPTACLLPRDSSPQPGPSAPRTPSGTPHPRLAGPAPRPPPPVSGYHAGGPAGRGRGALRAPSAPSPEEVCWCPGVYSCLSAAGGLAEFSVGVAHQAAAVTAGPAYGSHLRGVGGQIGARWRGGRGRGERRDARRWRRPESVRELERPPD